MYTSATATSNNARIPLVLGDMVLSRNIMAAIDAFRDWREELEARRFRRAADGVSFHFGVSFHSGVFVEVSLLRPVAWALKLPVCTKSWLHCVFLEWCLLPRGGLLASHMSQLQKPGCRDVGSAVESRWDFQNWDQATMPMAHRWYRRRCLPYRTNTFFLRHFRFLRRWPCDTSPPRVLSKKFGLLHALVGDSTCCSRTAFGLFLILALEGDMDIQLLVLLVLLLEYVYFVFDYRLTCYSMGDHLLLRLMPF